MAILVVVLLVLWAVLAVIGFAFEGLMWLGIIAIILFVGTVVVAILRRHTVARRTSPATGARTTGKPASPSASPNAAPTAKDQRKDGTVSDDSVNPAGNLE